MNKVYGSTDEAVVDIPDGASVAVGGFFTAGMPVPLIQALARHKAKDLTLICQQIGPGSQDLIQLVLNKQIRKAICSYPFFRSVSRGANCPFEQAVRAGEIELEVFPMGTFIEKLRAAAAGIAAFYTPTGVGTVVEAGKEKRTFRGCEYLLELALKPDYALVYAHQGDALGNLICRKTARNYNPEMSAAARITIAAIEVLVDPGELDPDKIHVPGIYVQRVVGVGRPSYFPSID